MFVFMFFFFFSSDSVTNCSLSASSYNESYIKNTDLHKDPESVLQKLEVAFLLLQVNENEPASHNYESDKTKAGSDSQENLDILSSSTEVNSVKFNPKTSDISLFSENDILKECIKVFILNSKLVNPKDHSQKTK